jgi:hypothetical protein
MNGGLNEVGSSHLQAMSLLEEIRDQVRAVASLDDFEGLKGVVLDRLRRLLDGEVQPAAISEMTARLRELGPHWRRRYYRGWREEVGEALSRLCRAGDLPPTSDIEQLASLIVTTIVGGYVLSETLHDARPMAAVLEIAAIRLRSGAAGRRQGGPADIAAATSRRDRT